MKVSKKQLRRIIRESLQLEMFDTGSMGTDGEGTSLAQKKEQCELAGGKWISDDPSGKYGHCSKSIKEKLLREADTDVYEGDHDPIRIEIPALKEFATEENFDGEKVWFSDTDASAIADILETGEPDREQYEWDTNGEEEYKEAKEKWNKIGNIFDFSGSDMEELAKNIRDQIGTSEDSGYEY